jgi:hypothetical protein
MRETYKNPAVAGMATFCNAFIENAYFSRGLKLNGDHGSLGSQLSSFMDYSSLK